MQCIRAWNETTLAAVRHVPTVGGRRFNGADGDHDHGCVRIGSFASRCRPADSRTPHEQPGSSVRCHGVRRRAGRQPAPPRGCASEQGSGVEGSYGHPYGIDLQNRGGAHRRTANRVAADHCHECPQHDRLGPADERDVVSGHRRVAHAAARERSAPTPLAARCWDPREWRATRGSRSRRRRR
jgi:hypothetical protein